MNHNRQKKLVHYDKDSDVLYLGFRSGVEEELVEIVPGINVEFDEKNRIIGIEILNALQTLAPLTSSVKRQSVQTIV